MVVTVDPAAVEMTVDPGAVEVTVAEVEEDDPEVQAASSIAATVVTAPRHMTRRG